VQQQRRQQARAKSKQIEQTEAHMKGKIRVLVATAFVLVAMVNHAVGFEMTPAVQAELDKMKTVISGWASDPVIVKAVAAQNGKGPLSEMDNPKWKTVRRSDAIVKEFQSNPAGQFLKSKLAASAGAFTEAFLNGAQGEKVAFVEKTSSYIHKGQAKFDVPFGGAKSWQGKAEFDESAQTYQIQISVPVLDSGKSIGALVVGVNLSNLEKLVK
jgi:hypothetical protein